MAKTQDFSLADETIALLKQKTAARLVRLERKIFRLGFDELNAREAIYEYFRALDRDAQDAYRDLMLAVYLQIYGKNRKGRKPPDDDWLLFLLYEPNPTTKYSYTYEVLRKQERAFEAFSAEKTTKGKKKELEKQTAYFLRMTTEYVDIVSDEATKKAFKDAGIDKVRWITQGDAKVCDDCRPRHGQIYAVDAVPPRHWHCRCILRAVSPATTT